MYTDYTEFELIIEPRTGGGYPFAVRSPGGEARGLLRPPTDDPALQGQLARLAALDADEALLTTIGQALFSALFAAPAKELLVRSQAMLAAHQGLRLKLCLPLGDEQLAALPWELLYDPDQGPLALLDAPIVRYLPQPTPLPTLRAALPLRVLLSAAEPGPEVARELAEVQAALAELAGHVQITVEPALTGPKLQQLLREGFHVWHFVGRSQPTAAGRPGGLAIGGAGSAELIGPAQLGILLNRSGLRLVVLDDIGGERLAAAALQGFAPALLRAQVGALVTTQFTAPAESARAFVGEFYRTLAAGFPIDACVTEGRKAVMGASGLGCADWALPMVYTRAPDARLFELPPAADLPGALLATQVDQSFARATVSSFAGTLLQPGQPPAIQRIEQRPRAPRALRSFRDRAAEQQALLPELQPGRGAWLYGPDGCGLTALLRQAANSPPAGALPDGVLFLDGVAAPDTLDDLAQQLFERFYTSETAVRVAPASARSYLGELQALFIFDELPLSGDQLMALADILTRGTVLIAASGAAPDTLLGLALRGLPRADARTLLADEARLEPAPPETLLDQLAEALGDLPLALLLAGRVLQLRLAPAEQLAAVLAEALAEPDPLARAARLSLTPLEPAEREVLTALVHIGGLDATLDALAATSQVPADRARTALDRLCELRLVEGGGDRYAVASPGLGHVLARLLPAGEHKARAAAFFAGAAALHLRDLGWLARELPSLRAAVETLLAAGRPAEAGALARAIQPVLTLRGRWGQWGQLIDWANRAADASGDLRLKAWALHEQGSRLGLLGERAAALAALSEARRLRLSLHDSVGAQASQQNLSLLELLPPPPPAPPERRWPALKWLAPVLLLLALLGGGATLASRLRSQESAPTATALAPTAPPAATPLAPGGTAPPAPTLLPSATASATPNPTATASPLPPSATATASPTLSPTATASATPSPTVTASPTPAPLCTVIGAGISVRAGPGVIYPTIGRLARGDSFTPLARDRQGFWVQLRLGQRLGWVSVLPGILSCTVAPGELPPGTIPPTPLPTSTATLVPTPTLAPAPTLAPTATPLPAPTSAQPTARPRRTATPTPARPTRPPRPTATATVPILR